MQQKSSNKIYALFTGTYLKAQITALLATTVDFTITILLAEWLKVWYLEAVAAGAACGAITAFLLNRSWVFRAQEKALHFQALRYLLVAAGSWFLNTGGVYLLTETTGISYLVSKSLVSIIVGLTYNYMLAKRFVFV